MLPRVLFFLFGYLFFAEFSVASQLKMIISIEPRPSTSIYVSPLVTQNSEITTVLDLKQVDDIWVTELELNEGEIIAPISINLVGEIPEGYAVVGISLLQPFYESGEHDILIAPIKQSTSASTIRELYATSPKDLPLEDLFVFYQKARYAAVNRIDDEPIGSAFSTRTIRAAFKFLQSSAELSKRRNIAPGNDEVRVVSWLKHAIANSPEKISDGALPSVNHAQQMVNIIEKSMGHRMNTLWEKIIELPRCDQRIPLLRSYKEKLVSYPNFERSKIIEVTRIPLIEIDSSIAQCLGVLSRSSDIAQLNWYSLELNKNINDLKSHLNNDSFNEIQLSKLKSDITVLMAIKQKFNN